MVDKRSQVEVPEIISADQQCFRTDQLWFSLNQRSSELQISALNSGFRENQLWSSAVQCWFLNAEIFGFGRWRALIQLWLFLNWLWYRHVWMGTINCDNIVREWMAFQVLKKKEISQLFTELQRKLKFSKTILKLHSTKRKKVFENLNPISLLTLVAPKKPKNLNYFYIFGT